MANFFLTNKAVEDLSKIWDYTYEVWSESQADKYYNMITDFFKEMSEHPEQGKNYSEIDTNVLGFKAGKHIVFFKIVRPNEIEILRILHKGMDLKNRMQE